MKQHCKNKDCPVENSGNYGTKACEGCKILEEMKKDDDVDFFSDMFGFNK